MATSVRLRWRDWDPGTAALLAAGALACGIPLVVRNQYYLHTMVVTLLYAYLATSWNILGGLAGQFSLGHATFVGLGAYTSTLLFINWNLSPWLGMLVGAAVAALASVCIGYPCFRLRGPYFALSTIALTWILKDVFESTYSVLGIGLRGASGLLVPLRGHSPLYFQFERKEWYFYVILALLALSLVVTYRIRHSRLGLYLLAVREDQDAAASLGINVFKYKLLAGMISSALTALGGTFFAQLLFFISPAWILAEDLSVLIALMAIVGGRGTILGPLLGAALIMPVSEICRTLLGGGYAGVHLVLYGAILMVVVIYWPHGLAEPLARWSSRLVKGAHNTRGVRPGGSADAGLSGGGGSCPCSK